jgi:hypothetical protein
MFVLTLAMDLFFVAILADMTRILNAFSRRSSRLRPPHSLRNQAAGLENKCAKQFSPIITTTPRLTMLCCVYLTENGYRRHIAGTLLRRRTQRALSRC